MLKGNVTLMPPDVAFFATPGMAFQAPFQLQREKNNVLESS
jgi:hypothetical protein